jgi:glycosyltransferase involved in cell wall biosynthesis
MGLPTVAVVLSVRNGADHLAGSIESVLAQTGVDVELRIYDNGSTDGSLAIAQQYTPDGRVAVTRNPPGLTFPHSMNLGLEATMAEYFVAWACDDEMRPGNLQHKVEALATSGAGIAMGGWEYEGPDGGLRGVSWPAMGDQPRLIDAPGLFPMIATANAIAMPTVVMRTEALRAVGGFDVRPELTCDWLLWLRLALRVSAVWLPAPLVLYRQHDDNGSSRAWREGTYARELLATVDQALADDCFPPAWHEHEERIRCGVAGFLADGLLKHGHRTLGDSAHPAHASVAHALVRHPASSDLRDLYRRTVTAGGLTPPSFPAPAVAAPTWEDERVEQTLDLLGQMHQGGLVDGVAIAVHPDELDQAVSLLEPALERRPGLDVDLVVCEQPEQVLRPGAVFAGPWGEPGALAAEQRGVPAVTHGMPTPFDV